MIIQFENNMSNFALDVRSMKDSIANVRKMIPSQGEKITQLEARHDDIIRALRDLGRVMNEKQMSQGMQ